MALVRECHEEVRLTPRAFDLVTTLYEDKDSAKKTPFHIFRVPIWDGGSAKLLGTEHSELGWFGLQDMLKLQPAFPGYWDVVAPLLKA